MSHEKKLTLTIDEKVINSAKKYSQEKWESLSNLVENYLKLIALSETDIKTLSPRVSRLIRIIELPGDFNHKNHLGDLLRKNKFQE